jgi:short-subunit dehydrogenase
MYRLASRTALLTGASSGIGRALAKALAQKGVRLAISGRRAEALQALEAEIVAAGGARPAVLPADLSQPGQARALAAGATAALGPVDILVNNAGVGIGGAQHIVGDDAMAREMFETNYWSPMALIQTLVPPMRARGLGLVVNVSSIGAMAPMPLAGHYSSSKAALAVASESLTMELRDTGVRVLHVIPGPVETAMLAELRVVPGASEVVAKMPRGTAEELARTMVRAMEREKSTVVYPSQLGFLRHFPTVAMLASRALMQAVDVANERTLRGGSRGDEAAVKAREAFEAHR